MPKIRFLPADVVLEVAEGTTIFGAARKSEVAVPSQCGGRCACALCRVEIVEGGHLVSPIRWDEEEHLGNSFHLTGQRLSCQCRVFGDVTVRVVDPPVKEKVRGQFVPRALMRKRESMEAEEDLRRALEVGTAGSSSRNKGKESRRRRPKGRTRNPGAPRRGDSRPPSGAKKK